GVIVLVGFDELRDQRGRGGAHVAEEFHGTATQRVVVLFEEFLQRRQGVAGGLRDFPQCERGGETRACFRVFEGLFQGGGRLVGGGAELAECLGGLEADGGFLVFEKVDEGGNGILRGWAPVGESLAGIFANQERFVAQSLAQDR